MHEFMLSLLRVLPAEILAKSWQKFPCKQYIRIWVYMYSTPPWALSQVCARWRTFYGITSTFYSRRSTKHTHSCNSFQCAWLRTVPARCRPTWPFPSRDCICNPNLILTPRIQLSSLWPNTQNAGGFPFSHIHYNVPGSQTDQRASPQLTDLVTIIPNADILFAHKSHRRAILPWNVSRFLPLAVTT